MKAKPRYRYIGILLAALALAACNSAGPGAQAPNPAPTAAPPSAPSVATGVEQAAEPPATAIPAPTAEPTAPPAAVPAPTTPPTSQPTVTPVVDVILPNDMPWVFRAGVLYGDDESLDFQQRGYPAPGWGFQSATDGSYLAYISQADRLVVIDMRSGDQITPEQRDIHVAGFSFSPDSRALAYRVADGPLQILNLRSGQKRTIAEPQTDQPLMLSPVAWTAGGLIVERLLWGSDAPPQGLALIDPSSGAITSIREHNHLSAAVSPDGRKIALVTGSAPIGVAPTAAIAILDLASGAETTIVPVQQLYVKALRWSPDGSKLLYAASTHYQAYTTVTTLHIVNADGTNDRTLDLGGTERGPAFTDTAWRDNGTLLLLSAEGGPRLQLYKLALASFETTGLQPLMGIRHDPDQRRDQIVYVPR